MLVYKIFRAEEWRALCEAGATAGSGADLADGFIHLASAGQLAATAERHFAGETGLVVAALEAEEVAELRWEPSRGGALFPHLYRPLRLDELAWAEPAGPEGVAALLPPDCGHVDPERAQFEAFKALPRDAAIEMLNLVRFRARAAYPPDHPDRAAGLTGAEAHSRYGAGSRPVLERVGGAILWRGGFEATLIGPADERWDVAFIARYPDAGAFLAMVTDPAYREAVVHRQAAVLTSRLIRFGPARAAGGFC